MPIPTGTPSGEEPIFLSSPDEIVRGEAPSNAEYLGPIGPFSRTPMDEAQVRFPEISDAHPMVTEGYRSYRDREAVH